MVPCNPGLSAVLRCFRERLTYLPRVLLLWHVLASTVPSMIMFAQCTEDGGTRLPVCTQLSELGREVENGRLLRLLVKLGFINERPEGDVVGAG
jgi:hypothetical protein